MKKKFILILFLLCAALQLFLSVSSVLNREKVLSDGTVHKFRTAPADPYDPFRGKYLALSIEDSISTADWYRYEEGEKVFVTIEKDSEGFSGFSGIAAEKPDGNDYLEMKIDYINDDEIIFEIPFDRYYIEEEYAENAEAAFRKSADALSAFVEVRTLNGRAVLSELFLDGQPVLDYLEP